MANIGDLLCRPHGVMLPRPVFIDIAGRHRINNQTSQEHSLMQSA